MSIPARTQCRRMHDRMHAAPTGGDEGGVRIRSDGAGQMKAPQSAECALGISLADSVGVSTSVRPGRGRNRTKTELEEKVKKPAEDVRKKSPPARKAPARGRYVDEYARPAR
jgi:hypothetical protein